MVLEKQNIIPKQYQHIQAVMKYQQLYKEIRRRIMLGEYAPGSCIPPERELAGSFAVSRVTVRSALGKLVEEGILERNGRCGTVVKCIPLQQRQLRNNRNKTILYIYFSSLADKRSEQETKNGVIYSGVESFANSHGFSLIVQSEDNYLKNGIPEFSDGVIMGGRNLHQHLTEVRSRGIPAVALSLTPGVDADMVCWDDFGAGGNAALRAAQLGYRNILLTVLQYSTEDYLQPSFRRRIAGFMDLSPELQLSVKKHIYSENDVKDPGKLQKKLSALYQKNAPALIVDCSGQTPAIFGGIPAISIGAPAITNHPSTDFFYCDEKRIGFLAAQRLAAVMENTGLERLRLLVPIKTKFTLQKLKDHKENK